MLGLEVGSNRIVEMIERMAQAMVGNIDRHL